MVLVLLQDLRPDVTACGAVCRRIQQLANFSQRHVQAAAGANQAQLINVMRAVAPVAIVGARGGTEQTLLLIKTDARGAHATGLSGLSDPQSGR